MKQSNSYQVMAVILAVSLFVIFSGFSYRHEAKLGYIQSERLAAEYSGLVEAQKTIEQERIQKQNDLQRMQEEGQKKLDDYESQKLLMSATRKQEVETELAQLQATVNTFMQENFGQGGLLDQRWIEISQPIIDEIQVEIDKLGEDEGFDIIFDARAGNILYGRTDLDITDRLLEILENKK
ncbi:OmpH family outer membrane protein [candidate division KSB1 bacterium]